MFATKLPPEYHNLLDFLVEKATPQEILAYKASSGEQARADELTEKNKSGRLTEAESQELNSMLELDLLVMGLKARALAALKNSSEF